MIKKQLYSEIFVINSTVLIKYIQQFIRKYIYFIIFFPSASLDLNVKPCMESVHNFFKPTIKIYNK